MPIRTQTWKAGVYIFAVAEKPLRLLRSDEYLQKPLSPNDMWEIIVPDNSVDQPPRRPVKGFGVVKIISLDTERRIVQEGIVGFQRHVLAVNIPTTPPEPEVSFSEAQFLDSYPLIKQQPTPPEPEVSFSEAPLAAIPLRESPGRPNNWEREYQIILGLPFP